MDRTRWWLIAVAGLLAAVIVIETIGFRFAVALATVALAAIYGYRFLKTRRPPGVYCLKCGEQLPSTARHCDYCGSAATSRR